ncbi:MAG: dodecin family protein [Ardenticatenaceae bacterium]|nr:dodecin family protein [Ardenticatenaceae bacterium]
MAVAKVIEIVANSDKSFDDAVQQGLAEAARSVRGIHGIEITNWTADVQNNQIVRYKVTMDIAFRVEQGTSVG